MIPKRKGLHRAQPAAYARLHTLCSAAHGQPSTPRHMQPGTGATLPLSYTLCLLREGFEPSAQRFSIFCSTSELSPRRAPRFRISLPAGRRHPRQQHLPWQPDDHLQRREPSWRRHTRPRLCAGQHALSPPLRGVTVCTSWWHPTTMLKRDWDGPAQMIQPCCAGLPALQVHHACHCMHARCASCSCGRRTATPGRPVCRV
jgi:hypothetical protein